MKKHLRKHWEWEIKRSEKLKKNKRCIKEIILNSKWHLRSSTLPFFFTTETFTAQKFHLTEASSSARKIHNTEKNYLLQKKCSFVIFSKVKLAITSSITVLPEVSLSSCHYDLWTSVSVNKVTFLLDEAMLLPCHSMEPCVKWLLI